MITYDWWSNGFIPKNYNLPVTHQTARLTMTNNRIFGRNADSSDVWDLRDSVLELCEHEQRQEITYRSNSGLPSTVDFRDSYNEENILHWLSEDPGNGFIRIYPPDTNEFLRSCLIPCNLKTSVQQICRKLGIGAKVLHLQMNGDVIRRLEPQELPLSIQNDFLVSLGYTDIIRMQEEGPKEDLAYLIKFYSGKPICDNGPISNPIQGYVLVKKGGMFQHWTTRWCAIYNTRLHFYRDNNKKDMPTIFQLTGGSVERTEGKGAEFCLKIASRDNDKQIFLNFSDENDCLDWFKKCKKAADRLPTTADLSCCHLEYLPENVFVNKDLMVLNLQHNLLKDRPCDEDTILGWIDDFDKFSYLRSINLADNNLQQFPLAVCKITTLVELNLASNKIKEIPPNVKFLENLQALHLHNNHLTNLPDEIVSLKKLSFIILAFNRFADIPTVVAQLTNIRFSETEGVLMSGNQIERIATDVLMELKHARKLDLRLNLLTLPLTETMKFSVLEHLSHLDIRDNQISELDLRSVKTLTILHCERNGMTSLSLHGGSLKVLLSSCNCLDQLVIFPKPEGLIHIDISDNCLEYLPDWLSDCHQLKKLIAHENFLRELPPRLFLNAKKLNHVNLAHNHLTNLPSEIGGLSLESLQIQHNYIFALPQHLLTKLTRLTVFNSSRSLLQSIPCLNDNTDLNRLQELHLSGNFLGNEVMKTITGYTRLKTLNLDHNEISELYDEDIVKMVMLQELNVSSNQLQMLPESLGHLQNLAVLRAHSNYLTSLPNFCNAKSLRILDVGHNKLLNISVTDLMASKLNLLDIGLNEHLKVDRQEFRSVISKKNICLVDSSGQNRKVPGLTRKRFANNLETEDPSVSPWKVGFSESSGSRNKLCIQIVKFLDFNNNNDCLVGIFDGGRNSELPKLLAKNIKRIFNEEINHPTTREKFMKYAFLSAHKNLKLTGQKIGVSAALCHIHKTLAIGTLNGNKPHGQMFNFVLSIANVGDVEAVLCRKGEAVLLTRKFVALSDNEETQRVCKSSGIITEDGKVNGVTPCTRLLGCAHLYPHVIPEPFYISLSLQTDDEFVIVANHSFWKYVPYEEAVEEAYNIGNPIVASKHLQDLAECYGSKENIAVLVLRLNTEPGPSLGRLKPPCREMSIDDVEAAIQHDLEIAQRRSTQKRLIGGQHFKQLSFIKNNRPFLQRTMFPLDKSLINNDIVTSSNNNQKSEALKTSSSANDAKVQDDKSPSQAKVVTFEPRDLNSSNSTGSQTSHTSSVGSSNKAAKFSYNELNSSTTTSHGSSIEGSISFTHNGTHLTPTKRDGGSVPGESSSSSSRDDNNSLSPHNQQTPLQRSQGFKNKFPPPRPLVGKSENSAPMKLEISSPCSTEVEAGNQQNSNEVLEKVEEFKHPEESGKGFSNNLRVDGVPQNRRTSKITIPVSPPSRPQSRFIKRSSALEALNATNYSNPQANMYSSSDSLLCDSLSQLDPLGHLNKISTAKEKKLSMYLMPSKMEPSSHGVTHLAKLPLPTSQEVPVITRNKVSLPVVPEVVQNSPRQNNFSSSDVKDSEIIEIMSHKSTNRAPLQTKRGSIMNTIAMFESANASKPPIHPSSRIIIDKADDRTNRIQETNAKKLQQSPVLENSLNGALNPIKYQIRSTTRPLEIPTNIEKINRPSTIIRPSYSPNVGSLPKSCFDFNRESSSNNDDVRTNQGRQIEAYEIAKF